MKASRVNHIDAILSLVDSLFGPETNAPVPGPYDMCNSGFGDSHAMSCSPEVVHVTYTEVLHEDPIINALMMEDAELFQEGAELYQERDAYTDSDDSLMEWQQMLDDIAERRGQLARQINDLTLRHESHSACDHYQADNQGSYECLDCGFSEGGHNN